MVARWRTASGKDYGIVLGIFVLLNVPARQPRDRQREAFKKALGPQQTKRSGEAI